MNGDMTVGMQEEVARGRNRTHCSSCGEVGHYKTTCRRPHR